MEQRGQCLAPESWLPSVTGSYFDDDLVAQMVKQKTQLRQPEFRVSECVLDLVWENKGASKNLNT